MLAWLATACLLADWVMTGCPPAATRFEVPEFASGTSAVAEALAKAYDAGGITVVGGELLDGPLHVMCVPCARFGTACTRQGVARAGSTQLNAASLG